MNLLKQLGIGAVVGALVALIFLFFPYSSLSFPVITAIIVLYIVVLILWISAGVISRSISKLIHTDWQGDKEDEAEAIIIRKFYDYSFCMNVSAIIAILGFAMAVMENHFTLIIIGLIATIVSTLMGSYMIKLMKKAYPERNLPDVNEKNYAKKLLAVSDEGEKHIMLHGMYKAYNFSNVGFMFAIMGITLYSVATEDSQLFSIIIISIILLITNVIYIFTIRNK